MAVATSLALSFRQVKKNVKKMMKSTEGQRSLATGLQEQMAVV